MFYCTCRLSSVYKIRIHEHFNLKPIDKSVDSYTFFFFLQQILISGVSDVKELAHFQIIHFYLPFLHVS